MSNDSTTSQPTSEPAAPAAPDTPPYQPNPNWVETEERGLPDD